MKSLHIAKAFLLALCLAWIPFAAANAEELASARALEALRQSIAAGERDIALTGDIVLGLEDAPIYIPEGADICLHGHSLSVAPGYPEACLRAEGASVRLEELSLGGGVTGRGRLSLMLSNIEGDVLWEGDAAMRDSTVQGDLRAVGDVTMESSSVRGNISITGALTLSHTTVGGGVFARDLLSLTGSTVAGGAYGRNAVALIDSAVGGAVTTAGSASFLASTVHNGIKTGDDCELDGSRVGGVSAAGDLTMGSSTLMGDTVAAGDVVVFADSRNEGKLTLSGEMVLNANLHNAGSIVLMENAVVTGGGLTGTAIVAEKLAAKRVAELSLDEHQPGDILLQSDDKKLIDLKKFTVSDADGFEMRNKGGVVRLVALTTLNLQWKDGDAEQYILKSDEPVDVSSLVSVSLETVRGPLSYTPNEVVIQYYSNKSCSKKINAPKKKGTYYVKALYAGREDAYLASESAPLAFHIVAESHIAMEDEQFFYDGEPHTLSFSTVGAPDTAVKIAYYADEERRFPITGEPRIVGKFYAVATLEATEAYAAAEAVATLTIVRPQPVITMADAAYPYDKTRRGLTYSVTNAPREAVTVTYYGGEAFDVPLSKKPKEMGVYYVKATLPETLYYEGAEAVAILTIYQNEDPLTLMVQKPVVEVGQKLKLESLLPYRYIGVVSWRLKESPIAKLQEDGKLKALSVGEVKITATTTGGQKKIFKVRIVEPGKAVKALALDTESLALSPGQTARVRAKVEPSTARSRGLRWVSSNAEVATVESGTVTAVAPGKTVIFAVASSGARQRVDVVVD